MSACGGRDQGTAALREDVVVVRWVGLDADATPAQARVEKKGAAPPYWVVGSEVHVGEVGTPHALKEVPCQPKVLSVL